MNLFLTTLSTQGLLCLLFMATCTAKIIESYDAMGNRLLTYFNKRKQIQKIEHFLDGELLYTERFEWHPSFFDLMTKRTLEDSHEKVLISYSCEFDQKGQLLEEVLRRNEDWPNYMRHSYFYDENGGRYRSITIEQEESFTDFLAKGNYAFINNYLPDLSYYSSSFDQSIYEEHEFFLHTSGHHSESAEAAAYPGREVHELVRITFINGILNLRSHFMATVKWLSELHGNTNIHYIFRPTEGWAWDLLRSSLVKIGFISSEACTLAQTWKKLIEEMGGTKSGGKIIHYAHSIGGPNTLAAKGLMTHEELKMIQVIAFGSPTILPQDGFHSVVNYVSVRDGIGLLDILAHTKAFLMGDSHIIYIGSIYGIPFVEHTLETKAYRETLETLGEAFRGEYCQ